MDKKLIVTLIGTGQAKEGRVFIHRGPGSKCRGCEYFNVCVKNVKANRVYKIVKVRDRTLSCREYETEMKVVEVTDAEISSAASAKQAIPGAVVTFKTPDCDELGCENYALCFPQGLRTGDRCEVLEATENLFCPRGFPLRKVVLRLVPVS